MSFCGSGRLEASVIPSVAGWIVCVRESVARSTAGEPYLCKSSVLPTKSPNMMGQDTAFYTGAVDLKDNLSAIILSYSGRVTDMKCMGGNLPLKLTLQVY